MANSLPSFKPIVGTGATGKSVLNVDLPTANTEVAQALSSNLNSIILRARNNATLKMTFVSGESGTKYITLRAGTVLSFTGLAFASTTVYLQSDKSNTTVEILQTFS